MNATLRAAALAAGLLLSSAASAGDYPSGLLFSAGAGAGPEYGMLGSGVELELRHKSGTALAANLGVGVIPMVGVDLWSPGSRARLGVGVHTGVDWAGLVLVPDNGSL